MQADDLAYFDSEEFHAILNQYEESLESGLPVYIDADDLADIADYYQYNGYPEKARSAIDLALEYNPEAVGPCSSRRERPSCRMISRQQRDMPKR